MQKEYTLSINDLNEPEVLYGKEAIATILVRLLLLQPGTFPDRPKMGVGLVANYRYSDEEKISELRKEIENQVKTYLPRYQAASVTCILNKDNTLNIGIEVDDVLYQFDTSDIQPDVTLDNLTSTTI